MRLQLKCEFPMLQPIVCLVDGLSKIIFYMKTIVVFIVGLLIATAWAQVDHTHGIVWLPNSIGTLNGSGYHGASYQMGLRPDGVVVWRWSPYH
jgi:urea transporter